MVVKKSRKPPTTTSTSTSTTTTPPPTTTTTQVAPTTVAGIPITNDINELVASMLQNPQFASVINNQLKLSQQRNKLQPENSLASDFAASLASAEAAAADSTREQEAAGGTNSKQAQDLLQLLNLIQSLGGIDKITPYLSNQVANLGLNSELNSMKFNELSSNRVVRNESYLANEEDVRAQDPPNRQRRPQLIQPSEQTAKLAAAGDELDQTNPFVFSYAQPAGDQARGQTSLAGGQNPDSSSQQPDLSGQFDSSVAPPQLTPEIMSNLAQLESLFSYNQPGRQTAAGQQPAQMAPQPNQPARQPVSPIVESQPFTLEDAKFQPMMQMQAPTSRQQETMIRVQVPDQRGNQHRQGRPAAQRQQQLVHQVQPQAAQPTQAPRSQQQFNDINSYLPYLEGDIRQPVGQRLAAKPQQQASGGSRGQTSAQVVASNVRQSFVAQAPALEQRVRQQDDQLLAQAAPSLEELEEPRTARPRPAPQQRRPQQQQQQGTRSGQGQQQQRRRPPNRERGQRVNSADFPPPVAQAASQIQKQNRPTSRVNEQQRPRSLVILTAGPPTNQPELSGNEFSGEGLSDVALEERLRLLENGYYPSTSLPTDSTSARQRVAQDESSSASPPLPRQQFSALNSNGNFYQPTLSSTSVQSTSQAPSSTSSGRQPDQFQPTTAASASSARDLPTGRVSADEELLAASLTAQPDAANQPSSQLDQSGRSQSQSLNQSGAPDQSGPGASLDPQTGRLVCNRRGVFAHPNSCGQFIVCAPQSRSQRLLRPFEHHCPAEHIFHVSFPTRNAFPSCN